MMPLLAVACTLILKDGLVLPKASSQVGLCLTIFTHVRRVRRLNAGRRAALLAALTENLGDEITVVGSDAGLHVVVWVNYVPQAEENALAARAQAAELWSLWD
jgi:DNA-binding transcriptional MocR family regulator